jgi:hypothetical protein
MSDRYRALVSALVQRVSDGAGHLDPQTRRAILAGTPAADPVGALATQVIENPTRITAETFARLLAAGATEDELFECVCTAAVAASLRRLDKGLALLDRTREPIP